MKILVAVDGSKSSLNTIDWTIKHLRETRGKPSIELVTVRLPVPNVPNLGKIVGKAQIDKFYREDGEAALAGAKRRLDRARIAYQPRILIGPVAETIVKHAKASRADLIVAGARGLSGFGRLLLGSTASKLLHLADRPVLLVK